MDEKKLEELNLAPDSLGEKQEKHSRVADDTSVIRDGVRVHPQPTSDPLDPLNWSSLRKNSILFISCFLYFMFTYITTTT